MSLKVGSSSCCYAQSGSTFSLCVCLCVDCISLKLNESVQRLNYKEIGV